LLCRWLAAVGRSPCSRSEVPPAAHKGGGHTCASQRLHARSTMVSYSITLNPYSFPRRSETRSEASRRGPAIHIHRGLHSFGTTAQSRRRRRPGRPVHT
jgi:hypothetical protein